ncbi:LamB/YcsF family protein [Rubritalea tangerina]|uniref:LamB/YcsF family protein n=1 Tax=Rubritalea tangerina TaxID=430798 RepID=A0ABW4ZDX4_9BACT
MPEIFLNCDLGEWESPEETAALMPFLHMANIACGGHAGTLESITHCAVLAEARKPIAVSTGAHPGVSSPDRGRSLPTHFSTEDFQELLSLQIQRYVSAADLNHIKLHGALYHLTETNAEFRQSFLNFVQHHCLISIVCLAGGTVAKEAEERGLAILPEIFLDRNYSPDGSLLPRSHPEALIDAQESILQRLESLQHTGCIYALDGSPIQLPKHYQYLTACVHSDSPNSLQIVQAAKQFLDQS